MALPPHVTRRVVDNATIDVFDPDQQAARLRRLCIVALLVAVVVTFFVDLFSRTGQITAGLVWLAALALLALPATTVRFDHAEKRWVSDRAHLAGYFSSKMLRRDFHDIDCIEASATPDKEPPEWHLWIKLKPGAWTAQGKLHWHLAATTAERVDAEQAAWTAYVEDLRSRAPPPTYYTPPM